MLLGKANNNKSVPENERMDEAFLYKKLLPTVKKKMEGFNSINAADIHEFIEKALGTSSKGCSCSCIYCCA